MANERVRAALQPAADEIPRIREAIEDLGQLIAVKRASGEQVIEDEKRLADSRRKLAMLEKALRDAGVRVVG